jgi:amidohydrolase
MVSLKDAIDKDKAEFVAMRRDLHAHPELGFEEFRTADIVAAFLENEGIAVHRGLGGTGVVGTLQVGNGTRRIGLRADMDALAMPEMASRSYRSRTDGKMHACGHDGHTVMLLAAARQLARRQDFSGTVHFIFQPAEEGRGGAARMVQDGLFDRFPVDAVYGLHNMPGLAVDEIAVVEGPQLAASDRFTITLKGIGTHGAKPHLGRDAMMAAGYLITALQTIVARRIDPLQPAVVSVCALAGGSFEALNVIPDEVMIGGTARCYDAAVRDQIEADIAQQARGVAALFGIAATVSYRRGLPPIINNADATTRALRAAETVFGQSVRTAFPPSTAGDDFAFFADHAPGCYVWLGNGPAVDGALHHNSHYDFNDDAIVYGAAFWTTLVEQELAPSHP